MFWISNSTTYMLIFNIFQIQIYIFIHIFLFSLNERHLLIFFNFFFICFYYITHFIK